MNKWIECNLPWISEDSKEYEDKIWNDSRIKKLEKVLEKKAKKQFGQDYENNEKLCDSNGDDWDLCDKISDVIKKYMEKHNCSKIDAYKAYENKIINKDPRSSNLIKYRLFMLEYDKWYNEQEECAAINKLRDEVMEEARIYNIEHNPSFCRLGLNAPGTIIEFINTDGEAEQLLIGHMNTASGVCDDCCAFSRNTIIKRYKIVWSGEEDE